MANLTLSRAHVQVPVQVSTSYAYSTLPQQAGPSMVVSNVPSTVPFAGVSASMPLSAQTIASGVPLTGLGMQNPVAIQQSPSTITFQGLQGGVPAEDKATMQSLEGGARAQPGMPVLPRLPSLASKRITNAAFQLAGGQGQLDVDNGMFVPDSVQKQGSGLVSGTIYVRDGQMQVPPAA